MFSVFSQNYRTVYELKYKPNKNKDSIVSEMYALDIFPTLDKSNFYNYNYYRNDSVMVALHQKSNREGGVNINFSSLPKAKFPLVFTKNKTQYFSYKTIDGDSYKLTETHKPVWKMLKESRKIKNWICQKAETVFLGRRWIAWFASELSFSEGPYKFKGLPGLVVEVLDSENHYHFTMEAFYKISEDEFLPTIYKNAIPVTKKQYDNAYSNYIKDPANKLRQGTIVDESGNVFNINGGFSKKFIDEATEERLKKIKDFNNPLELE